MKLSITLLILVFGLTNSNAHAYTIERDVGAFVVAENIQGDKGTVVEVPPIETEFPDEPATDAPAEDTPFVEAPTVDVLPDEPAVDCPEGGDGTDACPSDDAIPDEPTLDEPVDDEPPSDDDASVDDEPPSED